jgi:hypothetical protein
MQAGSKEATHSLPKVTQPERTVRWQHRSLGAHEAAADALKSGSPTLRHLRADRQAPGCGRGPRPQGTGRFHRWPCHEGSGPTVEGHEPLRVTAARRRGRRQLGTNVPRLRARCGRPAATIAITQGGGTALKHLLAAAVRGVGIGQPLHLLGEQRLGPGRLARYFTRGDGPTAQYVMVGVAAWSGWTVMVIGMDILQDPMLHFRAVVLQGLLLGLTFPKHKI